MVQTTRNQLGFRRIVLVTLLGAFLAVLLSSAPPALAITIEGDWEVRCLPSSDDCPNFRVSFDAQGGIVDLDVWGENSRRSGFGQMIDDQMEINIHNIFIFKGKITSKGPFSTVAVGLVDDNDADGDDVVTPAIVRRITQIKKPPIVIFNKNLRVLLKTIKRHIACNFHGDCDP